MSNLNYDPNLFNSGNRAKQKIRITFGQWNYSKTMEVDFYSNVSGLDAFRLVVERIVEELPRVGYEDKIPRIVLKADNGDELIVDDEECEWGEWLLKMVIKAEIVAIEPAGKVFDPIQVKGE